MQIQCRCSRTGSGKLFSVRIFSGTNSNTSNWEDSKLVKLSDLRRKQSQRLYLILNIGYHAVDGSLKKKKSEGDSASYKPASLLADQSLSWLHTFQGGLARTTSPQLNSFSREGQGERRKAGFEPGSWQTWGTWLGVKPVDMLMALFQVNIITSLHWHWALVIRTCDSNTRSLGLGWIRLLADKEGKATKSVTVIPDCSCCITLGIFGKVFFPSSAQGSYLMCCIILGIFGTVFLPSPQ